MSENVVEPEPCRHCGTETTQRTSGIPYCSMVCIGGRRRYLRMETLACSYPGCSWEIEYDPKGKLSLMKAEHEIDKHREEHYDDI